MNSTQSKEPVGIVNGVPFYTASGYLAAKRLNDAALQTTWFLGKNTISPSSVAILNVSGWSPGDSTISSSVSDAFSYAPIHFRLSGLRHSVMRKLLEIGLKKMTGNSILLRGPLSLEQSGMNRLFFARKEFVLGDRLDRIEAGDRVMTFLFLAFISAFVLGPFYHVPAQGAVAYCALEVLRIFLGQRVHPWIHSV